MKIPMFACIGSHTHTHILIHMFSHTHTHTLATVPELCPNRIMNLVCRGGVKANGVYVCVCVCVCVCRAEVGVNTT